MRKLAYLGRKVAKKVVKHLAHYINRLDEVFNEASYVAKHNTLRLQS